MDLQAFVNAMSENSAKDRSGYHLTYGGLIDALRAAPDDAVSDERAVGLGSYRGYYVDIALYTDDSGCSASDTDEDFDGDYSKYAEWEDSHQVGAKTLPRRAHELADFLEGLLGNYFTGYKGGEYEITRDKALWLAKDYGDCSELAVVGIGENLELVTKLVEV